MFHDCINSGYHLGGGEEVIRTGSLHLSSYVSDQLLQHFVPNISSTNQMLAHTS